MNKFIVLLFIFFSSDLISQIDIDWIKLRDVYYKSEYREDVDGYYQTPYFGKSVEELDNKEVRITGFMLTLSPDEDIYVTMEKTRTKLFYRCTCEICITSRICCKWCNYKTCRILIIQSVFHTTLHFLNQGFLQ